LSIADRWIADWRVPIDGLLTAGWALPNKDWRMGLSNGIRQSSNLHSAICTQQSALSNLHSSIPINNQHSVDQQSAIDNSSIGNRHSVIGNDED